MSAPRLSPSHAVRIDAARSAWQAAAEVQHCAYKLMCAHREDAAAFLAAYHVYRTAQRATDAAWARYNAVIKTRC